MLHLACSTEDLPTLALSPYPFSIGNPGASRAVFGALAEHTVRSAGRRAVLPRRLRSPRSTGADGRRRIVVHRSAYATALEVASDWPGCSLSRRVPV